MSTHKKKLYLNGLIISKFINLKNFAVRFGRRWLDSSWWTKLWSSIVAVIVLIVLVAFGISQWYIHKHSNEPLVIGATFIPRYARYFDLDPKETLGAMINDLGIRRFRLVSYWDEIETKPGQYDFYDLDWQFNMIEKANGTVSLAVGLRQPRWPECHMPQWAKEMPRDQWEPRLKIFMKRVIGRYKDRVSLQSYQLENEYLLNVFGECLSHDRQRLVDEYDMIKQIDPNKTLVVSRSNNAVPSWPIGQPRADLIGASIYKRVWDKNVTKRYFEYPLPSWFYAFLAGGAELTTGRNTFIHEMQTEPWVPDGIGGIKYASLAEQDKSFNASMMKDRIGYGVATGMKTIDLWGVEWWYWRKTKMNDPSLWETGKQTLNYYRQYNK